jgi:hypothetical protein
MAGASRSGFDRSVGFSSRKKEIQRNSIPVTEVSAPRISSVTISGSSFAPFQATMASSMTLTVETR